jgi:hypothetical protein
MSFSRVKPTGWTANLDTVTAAQLNTLDTNVSNAVDSRGGVIVPTSLIEIQGSVGLKINGTGAAAKLQYGSRSVPRQQALNATTTSGNWSRANTPRGAWQNTASGGTLDVSLDCLPHGGTLTGCTVRWIGAAGHAVFPGGAPTMPTWTIRTIDADGAEATVASGTDTAATAGAYEAAHSITNTAIVHTVDLENYRYVLTMTGELGGNFIANAKILQVSVACNVTSQPEY